VRNANDGRVEFGCVLRRQLSLIAGTISSMVSAGTPANSAAPTFASGAQAAMRAIATPVNDARLAANMVSFGL
jgi:hypothetical protein